MRPEPQTELRRGWTTGACATAAVKAGLLRLWGGAFPCSVGITLPRGEMPVFALALAQAGGGAVAEERAALAGVAEEVAGVCWAEVGITKDAGDDPDVTHGALIVARVTASRGGVVFRAGEGVGTVTRAGLPIAVGEPAINPVPRAMMEGVVAEMAALFGRKADVEITISVPGGRLLAQKTWNPRLGIEGGLSILGTTGIVRPFSCAAWIASIHRGIDVARAGGVGHVAGCTGATSERVVQQLYDLPDHAMLDMGDFAGGLLKYLRRHPVPRLTLGGGIGKMTKLAQGAMDLHSGRSQVDFADLAERLGDARLAGANTALEAYQLAGPPLAQAVAREACARVQAFVGPQIVIDTVVIDRAGAVLARAGAGPAL
jgi:cobalt-precorrin-5B (C1)-methyltransferase